MLSCAEPSSRNFIFLKQVSKRKIEYNKIVQKSLTDLVFSMKGYEGVPESVSAVTPIKT